MGGVTRVGKMFNHKDKEGVRQKGVFDLSKGKFYKDYVLRDSADPNIPGTDVPRLELVYLGGKSVAVDDDDTRRVVQALKGHYASKAAQRVSAGKKKPPQLGEAGR
jgi:hypothetical protein